MGWSFMSTLFGRRGYLPIEETSPSSIGEGCEGVLLAPRSTISRGVEQ